MKSTATVILLVLSYVILYGQEVAIPDIIPPSPQASALGEYGNIQMNLFTGSPNISIPIYTLEGKEFSLPISLSYNHSIKVSSISSWVGLGWVLNAGGVISRSVNGYPDEGVQDVRSLYSEYSNILKFRNGVPPCNHSGSEYFSSLVEYYRYAEDIVDIPNGLIETQPDSYFYNFPGGSGKVLIKGETAGPTNLYAHEIPHQGLQFRVNAPIGYVIDSWEVITPDGTKFVFSDFEKTYILDDEPNSYNFKSSWYLTQIISANRIDVYNFTYSSVLTTTENSFIRNTSRKRLLKPYSGECTGEYENDGYATFDTYQELLYLESITYSRNGNLFATIDFESSSDRLDYTNGGKKLNKISVKDRTGSKIKEFLLSHSYFGDYQNPSTPETELRLKFDKITERGYVNNQIDFDEQDKYEFYYNNTDLPDRLYSYAIDHWGYYNGVTNSTLIPTVNDVGGNDENDFPGANRDSNPSLAKACVLERIKYPTGGITQFIWEGHKSLTDPYTESTLTHEHAGSVLVGGENERPNPYYTDDIGVVDPNYELVQFTVPSDAKEIKIYEKASCSFSGICGSANHILKAWIFTGHEAILEDFMNNGSNRIVFEEYGLPALMNSTPNYREIEDGLAPGDYTMIVMNSMPEVKLTFMVTWLENSTTRLPGQQFDIGGLRIKEILNFENQNNTVPVTKKVYEYVNGLGLSTGVLFSRPVYHRVHSVFHEVLTNIGNGQAHTGDDDFSCSYLISKAMSMSELGNIQGSHIGYEYVKEYMVDNNDVANNGYTIHKYKVGSERTNGIDGPSSNYEELYGQLLEQTVFGLNGATEIKKSQTIFDYCFNDDPNWTQEPMVLGLVSIPDYPVYTGGLWFFTDQNGCDGVKIYEFDGCETGQTDCFYEAYNNIYRTYKYSYVSRWVYLKEKIERVFDYSDDNIYVETKSNYVYNNPDHAQISNTISINSNNDIIETKVYYPDDYESVGGAVASMRLRNLSLPIETFTLLNDNIINAQKFVYNDDLNKNQLNSIYKRSLINPISDPGFLNNPYEYSGYELEGSVEYDNNGNIIQQINRNDAPISFIWSYKQAYPVAKIENASYTEVENAVSNISSTFIDDLNQSIIQSFIDTKLSQLRTELSNDQPSALVTTYTYDPLVGMTSQTDPAGITIYYEYDDFGRLKLIRDDDGNILKTYEYNFR